MKKEVLVLLTDKFADWEAAYAAAGVQESEGYTVKTISEGVDFVESIGGFRVKVDRTLDTYDNFENLAMVILPGGYGWREGNHPAIIEFVRKVRCLNIPVAAICGATLFLARNSFLDHIRHTGDELSLFLEEEAYRGKDFFLPKQVVYDDGFLTANETAAVAFAAEIMRILKTDPVEEIDLWERTFETGMF